MTGWDGRGFGRDDRVGGLVRIQGRGCHGNASDGGPRPTLRVRTVLRERNRLTTDHPGRDPLCVIPTEEVERPSGGISAAVLGRLLRASIREIPPLRPCGPSVGMTGWEAWFAFRVAVATGMPLMVGRGPPYGFVRFRGSETTSLSIIPNEIPLVSSRPRTWSDRFPTSVIPTEEAKRPSGGISEAVLGRLLRASLSEIPPLRPCGPSVGMTGWTAGASVGMTGWDGRGFGGDDRVGGLVRIQGRGCRGNASEGGPRPTLRIAQ